MFPGFKLDRAATSAAAINFRRGGEGPPVLLLHGYPQTHLMWHTVAPALAKRFTVVAADLRGYGGSSRPPSDAQHHTYSKRAMAQDMVELMAILGFERFAVVGHDRGGRVAYRLALDHPAKVTKLATLDIVPTHAMWTRMDKTLATATYHWLFLIQPDGLPETMIGQNPDYYLRETLRRWCGTPGAMMPQAVDEYVRALSSPEAIHAFCEDYRAGASVDFDHDRADYRKRKIACPMLALWGDGGFAQESGDDPLAVWRDWADDVRGHALPCGHFLPEERPAETLAALEAFL